MTASEGRAFDGDKNFATTFAAHKQVPDGDTYTGEGF